MDVLILSVVSLLTSTFAAMAGIGGGLVLIMIMALILPANTVVPLHGVVQLASNVSRATAGRRDIRWQYVFAFLLGGSFGAAVGALLVPLLPTRYFPLLLGMFILAVVWLPSGAATIRVPGRFVLAGAVQTCIALFVGAAGPLSSALLQQEELGRDSYVTTAAGLMAAMHLFKLAVFLVLGFQFWPFYLLLVSMSCASILGSWWGTRLRGRVPERTFRKLLKVLLTVLAVKMVADGLFYAES